MKSARLLIITNGPLCRNPRPLKEATSLGRAGYDVIVLTVRNHPSSEPIDKALISHAPFRREVIEMLPGAGPASFCRRLAVRLARDAACSLRWTSIHSLGPAVPLLRRARALPASLTIVHNETSLWVGARLIKAGRRVATDFEDWHSEDLLPEAQRARPLATLRNLERKLLHDSQYSSTTSHALADALHARYGGARPLVISNSFPLQPAPPTRSVTAGLPSFFWFSQTVGPGRGLKEFFAAWSLTRIPSRVVLLGQTTSGFAEQLLASLPAERRSQVSFLPLVTPGELPAVIARHDIGLALESSDPPNKNLTISNKILQYLNAGLPVVASETAGQREVLERAPNAGILVNLHSTEELAGQLDALLRVPARIAAMGAAARRAAEALYCWEKEAPRLVEAVERSLHHS